MEKEGNDEASGKAGEEEPSGKKNQSENTGNESGPGVEEVSPAASPVSEQSEALTEEDSACHNNNKDSSTDTKERPRYRLRRGDGKCSPWLPSCAEAKREKMC